MRVYVDIDEYTPERGLVTSWDADGEIAVRLAHGDVVIEANVSALRSLTSYLLVLAQDAVPSGNHLHLDDGDPLDAGSVGLVIEKR